MLHTWMPEDTLLVGARNILYKLEAHPELRLTQTMRWASLDKEVDNCLVKGKSHTDCQNYIKVLQQFKVTLAHRASFINGTKLICFYASQLKACQLLLRLTGAIFDSL